jgi:hypothetical protein
MLKLAGMDLIDKQYTPAAETVEVVKSTGKKVITGC